MWLGRITRYDAETAGERTRADGGIILEESNLIARLIEWTGADAIYVSTNDFSADFAQASLVYGQAY